MTAGRATTAVLGTAAVLYGAVGRRSVLTWGASALEAAGGLPGDELLDHANGSSTRAITIVAPVCAVWPWLAQLGPAPRGGAYTYDRIENLFGLNMHSSDRVLPEFQHPRMGDTIDFGTNRMSLERVEPGRVLAWRSQDGNWVWSFVLRERGEATRLISRNRFRLPTLAARLGMIAMEPASLVMERKMLVGIRQRAEHLVSSRGFGADGHGSGVEQLPVWAGSGRTGSLPPGAPPAPGTDADDRHDVEHRDVPVRQTREYRH
jgi:hypothetical protein